MLTRSFRSERTSNSEPSTPHANATRPSVVICVVLYVSVTGLIGANCLASLLAHFPRQAGAAAGLAVSLQFGLGMVFSALAGVFHDGTAAPMSILIGVSGIGCWVAFKVARRDGLQH